MDSMEIVTNAVGDIELSLEWDPGEGEMDDSSNPDEANFTLLVDGVPRAITLLTWASVNVLTIVAAGAAGVTSFKITQDLVDEDVKNTSGAKATVPQSETVLVP